MFKLDKQTILILIAVVVVVVFASGFGLKKLFSGRAGRLADREERKEDREEKKQIEVSLKQSKYFNPNYIKQFPQSYQLSADDATALVKRIKLELTFMGGRPSKMNGYFGSLSHSVQVTQLAVLYRNKYGRDLATDIGSYMRNTQIVDLYNIIKQLPD